MMQQILLFFIYFVVLFSIVADESGINILYNYKDKNKTFTYKDKVQYIYRYDLGDSYDDKDLLRPFRVAYVKTSDFQSQEMKVAFLANHNHAWVRVKWPNSEIVIYCDGEMEEKNGKRVFYAKKRFEIPCGDSYLMSRDGPDLSSDWQYYGLYGKIPPKKELNMTVESIKNTYFGGMDVTSPIEGGVEMSVRVPLKRIVQAYLYIISCRKKAYNFYYFNCIHFCHFFAMKLIGKIEIHGSEMEAKNAMQWFEGIGSESIKDYITLHQDIKILHRKIMPEKEELYRCAENKDYISSFDNQKLPQHLIEVIHKKLAQKIPHKLQNAFEKQSDDYAKLGYTFHYTVEKNSSKYFWFVKEWLLKKSPDNYKTLYRKYLIKKENGKLIIFIYNRFANRKYDALPPISTIFGELSGSFKSF